MNKIIFTLQGYLLHPEIYTKEFLEQNYYDALAHFDVSASNYDNYVDFAAVNAADAAHNGSSYAVEFFLKEYFDLTGENRQDYIDAINRGK